MSLPQTSSKYKGACKKCKVEYQAGTTIYKINEEYWCSNEKCPGIPGSPGEKQKETSIDIEAKLDQLWDICYAKSSKIIDEKYPESKTNSSFEREKQKLIMAQSFMKALCRYGD